MVVALLLACAGSPAEDRALEIVDEPAPSVPGSAEPIPDVDPCAGADAADGTLALDWCARISPEVGTIAELVEDVDPTDGGASAVHPGAGSTAGPPCGVTNLVGSLGLGGDVAAPVALYCDADRAGGMRFVRYSPESGRVAVTLLAAKDCSPVPGSGALAAVDGGWLAAWASTADPSVAPLAPSDAAYGVVAAVVDPTGALVGAPTRVDLGDDVGHVAVAVGAAPLSVAVTWSGEAWAVPLAGALDAPPPTRLASGVVEAAVAATPEGFVAATCAEAPAALTLWALDAAGTPLRSVVVAGAECAWAQRPAIEAYADGVVVSWSGAAGPGVAAFSAELAERWRYVPPGGAAQVAPLAEGLLVVSLDGSVTRLDDAGLPVATAVHPAIFDAEGSLSDLRLHVAGDRALFLAYGSSNYPIGGGHVNTFNYVELSAAPVP